MGLARGMYICTGGGERTSKGGAERERKGVWHEVGMGTRVQGPVNNMSEGEAIYMRVVLTAIITMERRRILRP